MKNPLIEKILKETPLETRLKVDIELAFINLLTELGYRENKVWEDDEEDKLQRLFELANELTTSHLETIKEWEKDGRP